MSSFFKRFLICLISIATVLSAVACGGGGGDDVGDEEVDVNLPADTEANLVALVDNDASEKALLETMAAEFNKVYPNIKIEIIQTADPISYIRSGDQVDLMQVIGENVEYYAGEGILVDLDPYMEAANFDESLYYKSMMDLGRDSVSGNMYMLARDYSRIVCFYNKTIFDTCGIDYPADDWTWEQFLATCAAIKSSPKFDSKMTVVQASMSYDILNWGIVSSYGVEKLLNDDYTLVNDETVKANWKKGMETAAQMITSGYSLKSGSYSSSDFSKGAAAMALVSTPSMKGFIQNEINFDVVSFPAIGDAPRTPSGTSGYSIAKVSKNKNAAWAFLNFIMSEEGQSVISNEGGMVPVLKSMAEDENADWRSLKNGVGEDINVDVFVSHPERDVVATWFVGLPAKAQNSYKGFYNTFLKNVCDGNKSFEMGYSALEQTITEYKKNFPEYFV
jgi:ABC superfamily ATP binding cassette transporter, extracellular solute-binding protein